MGVTADAKWRQNIPFALHTVMLIFNFMFEFPCIISLYYIKNPNTMQLWQYCLLVTARSLYIFGRFLRPSSGVLKTVVAATGACHGSG